MHVFWMGMVSAAQVPSKFMGLWEGSAVSSEGSWTVTAGITGGSFNSTVGLVQFLGSRNVCIHQVRLTTGADEHDAKAKKKILEDEDAFEGKSYDVTSQATFRPCWKGEFKFSSSRMDRILVDVLLMDPENGEDDEFSFALKRIDDADSSKTIDTCKVKAAPSPLAKLKSRLSCGVSEKKRKGG